MSDEPKLMGFSVSPEKVAALKVGLTAEMDRMDAPDYLRKATFDGIDGIVAAFNRFVAEKAAAKAAANV
jgi:hypothetical protein